MFQVPLSHFLRRRNMPWGDGVVRPPSPITVINDSRPIESNISTLWQLSTIHSHINLFCFKKKLSFNFDPFSWFGEQHFAWKNFSTLPVQIITYKQTKCTYLLTGASDIFQNTEGHVRYTLVTLKGSSDQETNIFLFENQSFII